MTSDLQRRLKPLIASLPKKLRDALLLAGSGDHSYDEIGQMLKIPTGTVKWRVSEARKVLKLKMAAMGYDGCLTEARCEAGWGEVETRGSMWPSTAPCARCSTSSRRRACAAGCSIGIDAVSTNPSTNPVVSAFRRNILVDRRLRSQRPRSSSSRSWSRGGRPRQPVATPAAPSIGQRGPAPPRGPSRARGHRRRPRERAAHGRRLTRPAPRRIEDRIVVATVAAADDTTPQIDPLTAIAPITVAGTHPRGDRPETDRRSAR